MPYRRSISTLGCPDLTLDQVFELARRHRLDGVEIRALANTTDVPAVLAGAYGTPARLAERLKSAPARVIAFDTSLRLADNQPADREDFLKFVPWAEAGGVPWLRVFDGGKNAGEAVRGAMADTVGWWREQRQRHGWQTDILVETHDVLFTAASIQQFLALAPGTAILWDSHHTWRQGGEQPLVTWQAIKPQVAHIHVKDSISKPSAKHPFTYVLPGDGEFVLAPLRAVLSTEFSGYVSLEWEKLWHPYLPSLDDALTAAAQRNWW
jgi:sugar phosphate isomerase/epimerase